MLSVARDISVGRPRTVSFTVGHVTNRTAFGKYWEGDHLRSWKLSRQGDHVRIVRQTKAFRRENDQFTEWHVATGFWTTTAAQIFTTIFISIRFPLVARTISDMSLPETRLTTRLITQTAIQRTFFCFLLWSTSKHCWNSYPRIENTIHESERSHTERGEWKMRTEEEI